MHEHARLGWDEAKLLRKDVEESFWTDVAADEIAEVHAPRLILRAIADDAHSDGVQVWSVVEFLREISEVSSISKRFPQSLSKV